MQCFKRNIKRCGHESWSRRQRNLNKDHIQYRIDSGTDQLHNVQIRDGSIFAYITEKISGTHYFLRIDLLEDSIVRLRIDESQPFKGKKRYSPNTLLEKGIISIETIRTEGNYYILDINNERQFRFNDHLQFELLDKGEVILSANSNGLFYLEYLREKPEGLKKEMENEAREDDSFSSDSISFELQNSTSIDFTHAWIEQFESEPEELLHGPQSVGMDFTFQAENVYGIPIHATDLSLKSTTGPNSDYSEPYRLYNLDAFEFQLNEPMSLYGNVPIMIGHSEKYTSGFYWHNSSETWVDIQKNKNTETNRTESITHWFSETGLLDVFFLSGSSPKDVFRQFTSIVGTQALPPKFALSYHQCRWNYIDEEDIRHVNAKFEEHNFPMDVLWLDIEHTNQKRYFTWDPLLFPNPRNMIDYMSSFGRKIVTIVDPHMKRDSEWGVHRSALQNECYVLDKLKEVYEGTCWSGESSWIDYTNPIARKWWTSKFSYDNYQGSTADLFVWNDMNEPSVFSGPEYTMKKNATHFEGWEHRDIHNTYGMWMQKATSEGLIQRNINHNLRPFVLSRSFFAGSQKYGAIWTGDNEASWTHLASVQPMLLAAGLGGISFIGADVGGFFGNPSPELLIRWYQAASYQPFFRAHAHLDSKRREPWLFGEEPLALMRDAVLIRYALLPYIYTLFHQASITGLPPMRPLFVEYPTDINIFKIQDTFLLGSDLLVTPVVKEESQTVTVYFPRELWYDIYNHERLYGGIEFEVDAPLNKIPVYQRGGSIIHRKLRIRRTSTQMDYDPFTLFIALNDQNFAEGFLYIDDGKSFDYQAGKYTYRRINYIQGLNTDGSSLATIACIPEECANRQVTHQIGGTYNPTNTVEKVVILGQKSKPTLITVFLKESDKIGINLAFEVEESRAQTFVILNPDCFIGNSWKILIQY